MSPPRAFHPTNTEEGGVVPGRLRAKTGGNDAPAVPATLIEAHEFVWRLRPERDAELSAWATYHRQCAEIYAAVAKLDVNHQHEAQYYVGFSIRQAREIEDQQAK